MKPILLSTDGSPSAAEATRKAIELADALHAPLVVATVWEITYEPVGLPFGSIVPAADSAGSDRALEIAERAADEARAAGLEVETVIRRGVPAQEICSIADAHGAQLIVLGSHGWGGFRRLLHGSVSTGVLHHTTRPVLVIPSRVFAEDTALREREKVEA
ncbi:MAG: universal stress protein [Gaiellaceae bacterium]|jgi:nucleotide-binding universal stress UspA family protein